MADNKPIQPPTGTRDLYPIEAARRRFITEAWRRASINHGFEEVDGPTFEFTELYTKKSGEGIVSEIFGVFSGKDEQGVKALGEKLARGVDAPAPYALRPEFTPTLARMYAAKAASLPKPTKWFTAGPFFRAERPQRGRLREFLQWNCDVIGLALPEKPTPDDVARATAQADAEVIAACVGLLRELGLTSKDVRVKFGHRGLLVNFLAQCVSPFTSADAVVALLDRRPKISDAVFAAEAKQLAFEWEKFDSLVLSYKIHHVFSSVAEVEVAKGVELTSIESYAIQFGEAVRTAGLTNWVELDFSIVRGLAYYTGMVFEVIVDGERAVAGGGRYDNLIELFGGPSTPAVGFGMGDVVLSLVLQDKGLMPSDAELMQISGESPDVFVISNGTPEADAALPAVLADLRRGTRESRGRDSLHARRTNKTTKNVGKLLQEAEKSGAHFAAIVESAGEVTLKNLRTREQDQARTPIASLKAEVLKRLSRVDA
ncbi:MAG: ATP phosphoribosyltransferase regulatory subunit [Phycisphaerales bacterium]|nr:ATP phosphoribosyltransferase regulatory subunit [Phycisphaerales bacterium]